MFREDLIDRAEQGELAALVELDGHGLLLGANESPAEYAARLRRLLANTADMDQALAEQGWYEVEGISVEAEERIPSALFEDACEATRPLYGFGIDWVPGFFINPSFGWLFGGCAFYFYPDFFALFIVRKSFANRERWLIYGRRELLAHELCHVARIGMASRVFEEMLAYQTATSSFRRVVGSVFRAPRDALLMLGGTFLLLAAQVARTLWLANLRIWPFWALLLGLLAFLGARLEHYRRVFDRARRNAARVAKDAALPLVFRCTDSEILTMSEMSDPGELANWFRVRAENSLRWQVVKARFLAPGEQPDNAPEPDSGAAAGAPAPAEPPPNPE